MPPTTSARAKCHGHHKAACHTGIGVRSVIYQWVSDNVDRFPAGNLHFDFGGLAGDDIGVAVEVFLAGLGVANWAIEPATAARTAHFRTITSQLPPLLMVL